MRTHRLRDVGLITVVAAGTSLRLWGLGRNQLDFDETFTATAGRLPLGRLLTFLRYHDTHPPLDYLVRAPLARHGVSAFVFRMPSFLASVAALIVFACWMRRYGRLGLLATAALSVGSFQLAYGRDARAYAALEFVGVVGAWLADDWLRSPDRRRAVGAGGAALVGMLLHSGGLALAVGLVTVAGLRRDRQAWWWRGSLLVAGATWAALWGPSFATQVSRNASSWIPLASPHRVLVTFNELVNGYPALALVIVVLAAAGLVVLLRRQPLLARVLLCCSVVPIALISGLGFRAHVLLPRTLAPAAWGVLLALAALVDLAFDRWAPLGVAGLVLVAGLMLPSTSVILRPHPPGQEAAFRWIAARASNGDAVGIHPSWMGPMVEWQFGALRRGPPRHLRLPAVDADTLVLGKAPWSGRVWFVVSTVHLTATPGFVPCGATDQTPEYDVRELCRASG